jgi:hypothetical protein
MEKIVCLTTALSVFWLRHPRVESAASFVDLASGTLDMDNLGFLVSRLVKYRLRS